ncbi:MAG: 3-isopropylmalate dehydratase small subunit [Rubrivivax sp.]|jgi:3-isopropylmalate/(R)-2-methylmalate dehydratase small subunit|nr:3-isopropylmalate dehydratase small subunit [Rubrivivax sp.]
MDRFTVHRGVAAPLLRINVDTDAIIPSREMKRVSKTGLGEGLFAGWRYTEVGGREPDPAFVLNQPDYAGASILLAGVNFGCGSSREHAVWALKEFGIRAVVAPSFGAIFYNNCIRNGLLPVELPEHAVQALADASRGGAQLRVDLQHCRVEAPTGEAYAFTIQPALREMLLEGLDPVALTLKLQPRIEAYQAADRAQRPWVYLEPDRAA